jgi:hypothetical protein
VILSLRPGKSYWDFLNRANACFIPHAWSFAFLGTVVAKNDLRDAFSRPPGHKYPGYKSTPDKSGWYDEL